MNIGDEMRREIRARDWSKIHLAGDRRQPISLGPRYSIKSFGQWWETRRVA